MKPAQFTLVSLAGLARLASAALSPLVSGTPMGFATGATGGGTASPVYPTTIAQLKTYLTSSSPQVIVLSGTYDFTGSEGTQTVAACNNYECTPSQGGQALLNTLNGCGSLALYDVTIDTAAYNPICKYPSTGDQQCPLVHIVSLEPWFSGGRSHAKVDIIMLFLISFPSHMSLCC